MKTLTEIKNEVAQRHGYDTWSELLDEVDGLVYEIYDVDAVFNEAILEYAKQCCEAQRESDALAARIKYTFQDMGYGKSEKYFINKDSILNNPLITDKV